MDLEAFSVVSLGAFIWAVSFMVPKAIKQRDKLAITSAVLTALLALLMFLVISAGLQS